jgi:hypothetical protein
MKTFQIWVEGYAVTGNRSGATLLGTYQAESWDEAVQKYMTDNPGRLDVDSRGYTDWGCRLFDNEADARKSFG